MLPMFNYLQVSWPSGPVDENNLYRSEEHELYGVKVEVFDFQNNYASIYSRRYLWIDQKYNYDGKREPP